MIPNQPHQSNDRISRFYHRPIRQLQSHITRWNLTITKDHQTDYLKQTGGHEVAHWIVYNINKHAQSHGITWKRVMLSLGLEPLRCHNYTCKPARAIDRPFTRHCSCGSYPVTSIKFKNYVLAGLTTSGETTYRCRCGRMISIHDVKPA